VAELGTSGAARPAAPTGSAIVAHPSSHL